MKTRTVCGMLAVIVIAVIVILCNGGCSKTNTITGPSTTDTVTVVKTIYDTVLVTGQSKFDFYDGLQQWVNVQLSPLVSYFPAVGTEDIIMTKTSETKYQFDLYWLAVDFSANDVYIYGGVFVVTKSGATFIVEDITPAGAPLNKSMPKRDRAGLAAWPGNVKLILVPER
jgi:hypothetical protein